MLAKLNTFPLLGIDAVPVEVEVDVSPMALPKTILVGLPEAAVKESTHRVARAMVNSGFVRPHDRIVINLAPAELPKQAASLDLPMTLGILAASGQLESDTLDQYAVVGELALDGSMRPSKGALSMAMAAAKQEGLRGIVVPKANGTEAAVVDAAEVIAVDSQAQAVGFFAGTLAIEPTPPKLDDWFEEFRTDGKLSMCLTVNKTTFAPSENTVIRCAARNNTDKPILILRPFGDRFYAVAGGLHFLGPEGELKYDGPMKEI